LSTEIEEARADTALAAIQYLAEMYDRPTSAFLMTAGLPLHEDGRLPFDQIEAAADHIGLRVRALTKPLARFDVRDLPAILRTKDDGVALVLERAEGDLFLVHDPEQSKTGHVALEELERVYAGEAVAVEPDPSRDRLQHQDIAPAPKHWFWSELQRYRQSFIYVGLAAAVVNLLGFAMPLFMMNVYDRIIPNKATTSLWVLACGVLLAFGLDYVLRLARAQVVDDVGRDLDARLSQKLFEKVMNIPLAAREGNTGAFAKRIADYESVREFFTSTTVVLVVDIAFVFVFFALILVLGGLLVLVPVVGTAAIVVAGFSLQKQMIGAMHDAQADSSLQHSTLVESIAGLETLKATTGEGRMLMRWRRYVEMGSRTQERLRGLSSTAVNLSSLFQQAISIGLIIGGFYLFNANKISMGAIIAMVMLAGRAMAPVGQFAYLLTRARSAMLSLATLQKIMDAPDERRGGGHAMVRQIEQGKVEFKHVTFRYPEASADSLADLSVTIQPGERIGIIGRVASGKSTLGRLICGLYPPTSGEIIIDEVDSSQFHPHEIRRQFRYVGQDADLFSGTIRDNLRIGTTDAPDTTLFAAVEKSGADYFLTRDAAGYGRLVGERGSRMSGGQRAFLTLARALVGPSRLLYLDEPTGAMDTQAEQMFIQKLAQALEPKQTLVVSTHRHAMLAIVDRLIVVDQGRIIADGPRDKILGLMPTAA
jgi:ATP-binding cassette, subfamily C, bacterial LapB